MGASSGSTGEGNFAGEVTELLAGGGDHFDVLAFEDCACEGHADVGTALVAVDVDGVIGEDGRDEEEEGGEEYWVVIGHYCRVLILLPY